MSRSKSAVYSRNNSGPSTDPCGTPYRTASGSDVIEPLLFIYNLSFNTDVVPDKLKNAKVIPIYKKGEMCFTSNYEYRPISLLSIFTKLLEKLMHKRLYSFLQKNTSEESVLINTNLASGKIIQHLLP